MNEITSGFLIIGLMFAFYHFGTGYARVRDVRTQLRNALEELRKDHFDVCSSKGSDVEWIEVFNEIARIRLSGHSDGYGKRTMMISHFLPSAEHAGSNTTVISRFRHKDPRDRINRRIDFERKNKLSGALLYYVTGKTSDAGLHLLCDEIEVEVGRHFVARTKNDQTASS